MCLVTLLPSLSSLVPLVVSSPSPPAVPADLALIIPRCVVGVWLLLARWSHTLHVVAIGVVAPPVRPVALMAVPGLRVVLELAVLSFVAVALHKEVAVDVGPVLRFIGVIPSAQLLVVAVAVVAVGLLLEQDGFPFEVLDSLFP